jgi:prophage tail gpP-like protein
MPIKLGDQIAAILNGTPVLTGHVHEIDGDDTWTSDHRMIHARDKTQDLIDSTVGPHKAHKPPIGLAQVARKTISTMGLDIGVIEKVATDVFQSGEVPSASVFEHGHAFLDRVARQRQVLLTTDGKGNLVITRNMGDRGVGELHRGPSDDPKNNILKAKYRNTDLNRHNQHGVYSQHSTNDLDYWEGKAKSFDPAQATKFTKNYGIGNDDTVRPERRKHTRAGHSLDKGKTKGAAAWRSNVAKSRGFQYVATVQGFSQVAFGPVWWPGLIVPVFDHKYEIAGEFLLVEVRFHQTWVGGSTTELTFTYPEGFSDKDGKSSSKAARTSSYGSGAPGNQSPAPTDGLLDENDPGTSD